MVRSSAAMTVVVVLLCGVACTQQPQVTGGSDEAGQEVPTTSPASTPQPGTLTFTGRDGWETWDRGAVEAHAPAVAWASTIPFDPTDLAEDAPVIPIATIAELGGDEARDFDHIVVTALTVPSEYDLGVGSGRPTNLQHAAFRMPGPEEPPGDYAVLEIPAPPILVRVYFAVSLHETRVNGLPDNMVDRAQAELDTLQITPGLSGEMTAVAQLGAHRDPRPLRVVETGGQPLPREGLVVARGRDISLLTTDGATIGSLGNVRLYYERTVPGPVVVRRGATFYVLQVRRGVFRPLADRDEAFDLSPPFQSNVGLRRPAGTVPQAGRWAYALPGPDEVVLAQWSGECEAPNAMLVTEAGVIEPVTGEADITEAPESIALGWDDAGRALVQVHEGACGSPFDQPGIYAFDEAGTEELIFSGAHDAVRMWSPEA